MGFLLLNIIELVPITHY